MANKNDVVAVRVPLKEKRDFKAACDVNDKSASEVIRAYMGRYVKAVIREGKK